MKMVNTRLTFRKKEKIILPTNKNATNKNNSSDDDSHIVNDTNSIKIASETQTQVIKASRDPQVPHAASEAPIEEVADLGDKTGNELGKTPVTKVTTREKAQKKNQALLQLRL